MSTTGRVADERAEGRPELGVLLFVPYRAMAARVAAALHAAGFDDVTPAQLRLLERVGPDGTRLTELAEAAQVTKQTAGFLVDQLERSGYVRRERDPADARAKLVRLTDRALSAQPVADAVVAAMEDEWRAHLGPRRFTQLHDALVRLREITDSYR